MEVLEQKVKENNQNPLGCLMRWMEDDAEHLKSISKKDNRKDTNCYEVLHQLIEKFRNTASILN